MVGNFVSVEVLKKECVWFEIEKLEPCKTFIMVNLFGWSLIELPEKNLSLNLIKYKNAVKKVIIRYIIEIGWDKFFKDARVIAWGVTNYK